MSAEHPWVAAARSGPRFAVNLAPQADWPTIRGMAKKIEAAGFDGIFMPDHPLLMGDAWTTLAGIAAVTERVRLGTLVSCVAYRHPVELARIAADVDRISNGRVVLGIGSGDMPWEFERLGLDYGSPALRQKRLVEALEIVKPLLAGEKVTFEGQIYQVRDVELDPPPVQKPIPILIAGGGRQTLQRVAEYADASNLGAASWAGGAFSEDDIAERWSRLRGGCAENDRSFDSVLRTAIVNLVLADTDAAAHERMDRISPQMRAFMQQLIVPCTPRDGVKHVRRLLDSGFQYIVFQGVNPDTFELLTREVLPEFQRAVGTP